MDAFIDGALDARPEQRHGPKEPWRRASLGAARRYAAAVNTELKRRAAWLGAAKAFETATQFLVPVVLARCLDAATFGEYRLLWLIVGTVMALAPLNMPHSLFYFLPRVARPLRPLYVHQVMAFLALAGALGALVIGVWNPLGRYGLLLPVFVALWVPAYLIDVLPAVEERATWQAAASVALTALRTVLIAAGAFFTDDLGILLVLLVVLAGGKLALLLGYVGRRYGLGERWVEREAFADHLRQSVPMGLWGAVHALRGQADQWIAAARFALQSFAAFSIAAQLAPLVTVCRQAVNEACLPSMSRIQAAGDAAGMMALNNRANLMVAALLYPLLGFVFAFGEDIVVLVYTAAYLDAVPVMRVSILGLAGMVVELGTVVALLRQANFALAVAAGSLALSIAVSWAGASFFGLAGAAAGSVLAVYVDRAFILARIAAHTGIPLRRLQDWRGLALLLAQTALASAAAWAVVHGWLAAHGPLARLCAGAALLGALLLLMRQLARAGIALRGAGAGAAG
jgi:O-antigen/teichoic acid export membrane protein